MKGWEILSYLSKFEGLRDKCKILSINDIASLSNPGYYVVNESSSDTRCPRSGWQISLHVFIMKVEAAWSFNNVEVVKLLVQH